VSRSGCA